MEIYNDSIKRVDGKGREYFGITEEHCIICKGNSTMKIMNFKPFVLNCMTCGITYSHENKQLILDKPIAVEMAGRHRP